MNKVSLVALLLSSAFLYSGVSVAADYEPPPPVDDLRPASYDWSGLYVAGWVGNACVDGTVDDGLLPLGFGGCGFKGGVGLGYNYQIQDWVLGVEVDYGMGGKINDDYDPTATNDYIKLAGIGTARAKLGYAFDDTMIFITGGAAYVDTKLTGQRTAASVAFSEKADSFGWTIGGGIEHAITDNFHLRLDYLYTQFAGFEYAPCSTCSLEVEWEGEHEVRLGGVWAFHWF
jgi:outer membrane immunogenic protein